jgi:hypothetical protein
LGDRKPYLIVNFILAGLAGLIFLYSGIFSAEKDNHPLPSFYEEVTGQASPSSGLSRAFSEIIRGELDSARGYNPFSLLIFAFFLIQFFQRIMVSVLLYRGRIRTGPLLLADVIISVGMLLYCFRGLIAAVVRHGAG